jgi:hypothetical protein
MDYIKESLVKLGIQSLCLCYKKRNIMKKILNELLMMAFDIWYYLTDIQFTQQKDLGLLIRENLTDDEIHALFWIFKSCNCCHIHSTMIPKSLNSLELVNIKLIPSLSECSCQCIKAIYYLYYAYHYNKYHLWI